MVNCNKQCLAACGGRYIAKQAQATYLRWPALYLNLGYEVRTGLEMAMSKTQSCIGPHQFPNFKVIWIALFALLYSSAAWSWTANLIATPNPNTGDYTLTWNYHVSSGTYWVQERISGTSTWANVGSSFGYTKTSKAITGQPVGVWEHRIKEKIVTCSGGGMGMGGCSSNFYYSETIVVTVEDPAPPTPTGLSGPATDADGSYTITWNSSTGATSYNLEEQLNGGSWTQVYTGASLSHGVTGNADGSYNYRVQACDAVPACSGWSSTHTVVVSSPPSGGNGPATPPSPGPDVDPGQGSATNSDKIGTTAGNFRVDESGAATYSVPIATAAGTAGVVPQVSLNYSSSAGNGIAGRGWSIGGLTAISRCRQTLDQDQTTTPITWTNEDRFCLDGQRLIVSQGEVYGAANSTYRTEIESGASVTAIGSINGEPDYFEIKRKDGSTSFYGRSPEDSSGNTSGKLGNGAGSTLTWSIRHFKDNVGNPIWFEYDTTGGAQRISEIKYAYGSNLSDPISGFGAHVQFGYESRGDWISGYVAGYQFQNDKRLKTITSKNKITADVTIRQYTLNYDSGASTPWDQVSRLESIQECVGSTCLDNDLTFAWRMPVTNPSSFSNLTLSLGGSNFAGFRPADINGDGLMDLVWLEGTGTTKTMKYAFSNGSSYTAKTFSNGSSTLSVSVHATEPKFQTIDYNLDGRQDVAYHDDTAGIWKVLLSEPEADDWRLDSTAIATPLTRSSETFLDVDSDGAVDAVHASGSASWNIYVRPLIIDPAEAATPESSNYYHFGNENIATWTNPPTTHPYEVITEVPAVAGDFDGDGKSDLALKVVQFCGQGGGCSTSDMHGVLVTISEFSESSAIVSKYYELPRTVVVNSVTLNHFPRAEGLQVADFNSDGLSDLFYPVGPDPNSIGNPTEYALQLNRGDGTFDYERVTDSSMLPDHAAPQVVDWNFDGHPDVLWKDTASGGVIRARYWNPSTNKLNGAILAINTVSTSTIETVSYFDVNGDAAPDLVKMNHNGTVGSIAAQVSQSGGTPINRAINRIEALTNGFGADTSLTYEPLSYSDHYDRLEVATVTGTKTFCEHIGDPFEEACWEEEVQIAGLTAVDDFYTAVNGGWVTPSGAQALNKSSPIIEMSGPMYVVTSVVGDAPAGDPAMASNVNVAAASSIDYYYSEAKIQAAGRGFLGFQRLMTKDNQSGVETTTRYRQDWPFIGRPVFTEVLSAMGNTLSQTTTDWEVYEWNSGFPGLAETDGTAALGAIHVLETHSGEKQYDLVSNGAAQGAHLSTVTTDTTYLDEGNADVITVTTLDANGGTVKTVATDNSYLAGGEFDFFDGRLSQTSVTTTYDGATPAPRISTFTYYTDSSTNGHRGLLWTEKIEPNTGFELTTEHRYDDFGNRAYSSVSDGTNTRCNQIAVVYDIRGRYADLTKDCLGRKLTEVTARNEYGSPTLTKTYVEVNGTDHFTTKISYSAMGREYYRYKSNGSYATKYLSTDLSYCPAGTAIMTTAADGSGAESRECVDVLGRTTRTMTKGFDGLWDAQDTEYDAIGRVLRKSEPFDLVTGSSVPSYWTKLNYDLHGRVTNTEFPNGGWGTTTYTGFTIVTTNDGGSTGSSQSKTEVRNEIGEVKSVTDNIGGITTYTYDHQGNMKTMVSDGNTTTINYDVLGRKEDVDDPDKGFWEYDYNRFGGLVLQTDAKGQTQTITYDGLGRMLTRVDKNAGGGTEGSTIWTYDTATYGLGQLDNVTDTQSGFMKAVLYDSFGRPDEVITNFDAGIYYEKTTYDELGRVFQVFDADVNDDYIDNAVVNEYNAHGFLESISDAVLVNGVPRTTYRKVTAMNTRGQVETEERGIDNTVATPQASVTTIYDYYDSTGLMKDIDGINTVGYKVQELDYMWDTLGNLTNRTELSGGKNISESFMYDGLNRLTDQVVAGQNTISVSYYANGNIKNKSDVGAADYLYGAGNAGPHAVTSAGGAIYTYDENGNNETGDGRSITYSTFDKPTNISKGSHQTSFAYGPDRARYRRVDSSTSGTRTQRYIGNVEIIFQTNGNQDRKRYIAGVAIETIHFGDDSTEDSRETSYIHKDHLGSLDVVTDSTGAVVDEMSFDAWGQRRHGNNWVPMTPTELSTYNYTLTTRGFTGHEMLDEVGLIHMNGRIYDQKLGRFMQADPIVQDPMNTQSLNRYSYVLNNPLNAIDPSGFSAWTKFRDKILKPILGIAISVFLPHTLAGFGGIFGTAAKIPTLFAFATSGFVAGAVTSGTLKGAAIGAFGGLAFGAIGAHLAGGEAIFAHGLTGGVLAELQGGKFGHGFLAATITKSVSKQISDIGNPALEVAAAAVVGGSVSAATGGKFGNGAVSAGFGYAFNQLQGTSAEDKKIKEYRKAVEALLADEEFVRALRRADGIVSVGIGNRSVDQRTNIFDARKLRPLAATIEDGGFFGDKFDVGKPRRFVLDGGSMSEDDGLLSGSIWRPTVRQNAPIAVFAIFPNHPQASFPLDATAINNITTSFSQFDPPVPIFVIHGGSNSTQVLIGDYGPYDVTY